MNEKDAKILVRQLIDVAYEAGVQHNSEMIWNCRENTMSLGNKMVRHLINKSSATQPRYGWDLMDKE